MKLTAFLAHSGIWNVDELVVTKVKLATLLCDQVIHSGKPDPVDFAEVAREVFNEPALSARTKEMIADTWLRVDASIPQYETWLVNSRNLIQARAEAKSPFQLATIESLLMHGLSHREHYEDYKVQSHTIAEITYWRRHLAESIFIGHSISDTAIQLMSSPILEVAGLQEALSPIPAAFPLSWNDVFDLRASPYYHSFRKKVSELRAAKDLAQLRLHYQEGLEEIAKDVAPSLPRAATLATLSNLPIPANPFHLAQSLLEVRDQWNISKEYGWVFFIRQAREIAAVNSTDA